MDTIIWIDVETSGLIAHREQLLEVACFVTDYDLNLLDQDGYHAVVHDTPAEGAETLPPRTRS